jgi:hypothetical protein
MRRVLLGAMGAVALGAVGVLLAGFMWPDVDSEVDLGPVEAFARDSVTSFYLPHGSQEFRQLNDGELLGTGWLPSGMIIHLVRREDGSFVAFDGIAARLDSEQVRWRPEFSWEGSQGWFRTPGSGSTFSMEGTRVFGPAPRDLDRFGLRIEDGRVIVDTQDVTEGYRPPQPERTPDPPGWTPQPTELARP